MKKEVGDDGDVLRVIDTKDALTWEEVRELKKLAGMSKVARALTALAVGVLTLFGVDNVMRWVNEHFKL